VFFQRMRGAEHAGRIGQGAHGDQGHIAQCRLLEGERERGLRRIGPIAPDADLAGLAPDADLRDGLELDSLDFLRFVEILSERTGKQIAEDEYPQLATLASTIKFLAGE
jgi:acyl carrier protein